MQAAHHESCYLNTLHAWKSRMTAPLLMLTLSLHDWFHDRLHSYVTRCAYLIVVLEGHDMLGCCTGCC